ncbi:hypothetical protein Tco_1246746 [Tanacetum coccineum]
MDEAHLLSTQLEENRKEDSRLSMGCLPRKRLFKVHYALDPSQEFIGPWESFGDPGQPSVIWPFGKYDIKFLEEEITTASCLVLAFGLARRYLKLSGLCSL